MRAGRYIVVALVPAHPPAHLFGLLAAGLVFQASFPRRARGFGRPAQLRRNERPRDQLRESLQRLTPVLLLGAVISGDNEYGSVSREPPPRQRAQTDLDRLRERGAARQIEPQLHGRGDFVDVLPAWTR